jgi:hypothetical protein
MWHKLVVAETFLAGLIDWDEKQAAGVQARGCPCGGRLDRADYPRKVRGVPAEWDDAFSRRISLCCARDGCRRRRTPASIRFFGRRVYLGAVILGMSAGLVCGSLAPSRTVRRWAGFFRGDFVRAAFWQDARARFMPPVVESALPGSLLERFGTASASALHQALSFLAPITTTSSPNVMVG